MRNRKFIPKDICYLCGKAGADTKDHIPPKGMFNTDNTIQRLTLPAHYSCNQSFSNDEEYFRDVFIQQAVALGINYNKEIEDKIWSSWSKNGWKRHQEIIKTAKHIRLNTEAGLGDKEFLAIQPDQTILERIAVKIARGIIYNDTGAYTTPEQYTIVYINSNNVPEIRQRDKDELFWKIMNSNECEHTYYGTSFAARRLYLIFRENNIPIVFVIMGLMLSSAFYIVNVPVQFESIKNPDIKLYSYNP